MDVVHRGVGAITESDMLLAKASGAIILGFHVRPDSNARAAAEREQVDVRTYRIIYEAVEDVRERARRPAQARGAGDRAGRGRGAAALQGEQGGHHRRLHRCGAASSSAPPRRAIIRDGARSTPASLASLKRFKDDVREVREGLECGIGIENFNDLKVGDRIESFRMEESQADAAAAPAKARRAREPEAAAHDRRHTTVVIGIQTWELHLPGCHSLKEKRGMLKPLTAALRQTAQRVGGGDRPPGPLAAGGDRLRGRGHRRGPWSRRPCAPPTGRSRRRTACGSWIR